MEEQQIPIRALAEDERPREKLMKFGAGQLSNAELLAILIGSGTRHASALTLAREIMHRAGDDLLHLGRMDWGRVKDIKGIGKTRFLVLSAALELGRRRKNATPGHRPSIRCSQDVFNVVGQDMSDLPHEEFRILFLNQRKALLWQQTLSRGGIAGTVADLRLIFKAALEHQACSIVACHNHPSGNLNPSAADKELTRRLIQAGKTMDIPLEDHIIIGGNKYYSFADEGEIF